MTETTPRWQWALDVVGREIPVNLVLRLTLLLLVLHGTDLPPLRVPIYILAGLLLVVPGLLRSPSAWWLLTSVTCLGTGLQWYSADNHKFLICYWTAACALSLHHGDPGRYLRHTGRLLVALVFLLAVVWKLRAGQYLDGSFIHATLFTDPRLTYLASWLSGITPAEAAGVREAILQAGRLSLADMAVPVPTGPAVVAFAMSMSWLALIVEGSIGLAHLSGRDTWAAVRHGSLLAFIFGTYAWLPVTGFAFVLTIIGLAQCRPIESHLRIAYLTTAGLIQLTMIPWPALLYGVVR